MGKKIREKNARNEAVDQARKARLASTKTFLCDPKEEVDLTALLSPFASNFINTPDTFTRAMKTRNQDKKLLALARHVFGRYKMARFWDQVWSLPDPARNLARNRFAPGPAQNDRPRSMAHNVDRHRAWYVCLSTGGSLYKSHTKSFLTKKETHLFATCPHQLTIAQALVFAVAKAQNVSDGAALRCAQSKLAEKDITQEFWRATTRFFAQPEHHPESLRQLDDLLDFISARRAADQSFSIFGAGHSLASLHRKMIEWHHELRREKQLGDYQWDGYALKNWTMENKVLSPLTGKKEKTIWNINQILNSKDLGKEGTAMRHCVLSYRLSCQKGRCSIWSLTSSQLGSSKRHLTIEMREDGSIIQARGFANRLPYAEEAAVLRRWAQENNLSISCYGL